MENDWKYIARSLLFEHTVGSIRGQDGSRIRMIARVIMDTIIPRADIDEFMLTVKRSLVRDEGIERMIRKRVTKFLHNTRLEHC
jgi:hypothetical protein